MAGPKSKLDEHEDAILARYAGGMAVTKIAEEFGCHRDTLYDWLNKPERKDRVEMARKASADAWVDRGLDRISALSEKDDDSLTSARVSLAKLEVDFCRWMAEKRDPDTYGQKQGPLLQLNMGDLHLEALQAKGAAHLGRLAQASAERQLMPAEIADDDEQDEAA